MFDTHLFTTLTSAWFVVEWLLRIIAVFVVPRNRKPSSGTAWLMVIFLFPILGFILFLVLGNPKLPKSRQDAQKTLDAFIAQTLKLFQRERDYHKVLSAEAPEPYQPLAKLSQSLAHLPVFGGNSVEMLPEYDNVFSRMIADIDEARHYIHIEFFIIVLDGSTQPVFDALARAVERGVVVRVMYDAFGCRKFGHVGKMKKYLRSAGVHVQPMLPIKLPGTGYVRPDLRNHRKLVVIDGQTGYTGSLNLIRRDYHRNDDIYYDELMVRVQGPVVLQLDAVFLSDWYSETDELLDYSKKDMVPAVIPTYGHSLAQVLPSGPGYEDENNLKLFTSLIHAAQKKIVITNPYFVPDDALTTAITSAARRGVEVVMINSEAIDQWMVGYAQRSFYETLLRAGVKIYLYEAPVLLHSKFITVDDGVATIGSSNLDIRSFELDLEVTLISYDPEVVKALRHIETQYLERSKPVNLRQWMQRPRRKVLLDNIARLTASLQ